MEGNRQPPAEASAAVAKVLDDDNLLIEILLRVGFPTTLVCAALVCRRWLLHASDPAFLGSFRKLHPPRLLGFYIDMRVAPSSQRFVTMPPEPTELATLICRVARCNLDTGQSGQTFIRDCRNGRVITTRLKETGLDHGVHNPLCPEGVTSVIPQLPIFKSRRENICTLSDLLLVEQDGNLSYLNVGVESNRERSICTVHVYRLQYGDDVWRKHLTVAIDQLHDQEWWRPKVVLMGNKIYMHRFLSDIIVLDLMAASSSIIELPREVDYGTTMLSRADDASSVYLLHAKELQLCIWLHKGDNWLLVDTICLREMCTDLRMSGCMIKDEDIAFSKISQVGDNAEFLFLHMGGCILYLVIKCKTLRKVYEMTKEDGCSTFSIHPFKMIWPPTFPALKDDLPRSATM